MKKSPRTRLVVQSLEGREVPAAVVGSLPAPSGVVILARPLAAEVADSSLPFVNCVTVAPGLRAPEDPGAEGLSPEHWAANARSGWSGYEPTQTVASVFGAGTFKVLGGLTLEQALAPEQGRNRALLRQAVAGLLNAQSPDVDYFLASARTIRLVQEAVASGKKSTVVGLTSVLATLNSYGSPSTPRL
jgi:hypothetical protein